MDEKNTAAAKKVLQEIACHLSCAATKRSDMSAQKATKKTGEI
jgi:hypothetical protein